MNEIKVQELIKSNLTAEEFTENVGLLVRASRSRRGLTRKNLAFHSDVSERYLAQVEGGTANISVTLLSRIAQALNVCVGSLLPHEEETIFKFEPLNELISTLTEEKQQQAYQILLDALTTGQTTRKGIALVGLRGAGKSTLGARLAKHFKIPFVRLDEIISQLSGMDMGKLISLRGQDVFRRFELQALQQTIAEYRFVVLETGGSLISESRTYRLLREYYFTTWIRAIPEDHMQRVIEQGDLRPLTETNKDMQDLKLILEEREIDYRLADHELMTSGHSIEECLEELIQASSNVFQAENNK